MLHVLMAMSGGVDSSVSAALLQQQGYEVVGVTMRLMCTAERDIEDARGVAQSLGFEHRVLDLGDDFEAKVVERFCAEYLAGRTPNPCIDCNHYLKFGLLHQVREELGCEYLATGHYVRRVQLEDGSFRLGRAADAHKDQSYFLYHLDQETLAHTLFPLGEFTKGEVRTLAAKAGLSVASKGESQDICFVKDGDYAAFIERRLGHELERGPVLHMDGRVMGEHLGLARYTVGQRKGLNLGGGMDPLYVVGKDAEHNAVIVGPREALQATDFMVEDATFAGETPSEPLRVNAKAGYRAQPTPAAANFDGSRLVVRFDAPVQATSPGQSLVLYAEDGTVVGGGIIAEVG